MANEMILDIEFSRVDQGKREVWGWATTEQLASDGKILGYEASVESLGEWIQRAGNIREMHESRAVAKAFQMVPDPENRRVLIGCRISRSRDGDDVWTKIDEGILTGFSVRGRALHQKTQAVRMPDGIMRSCPYVDKYKTTEVSLVDVPSDPGSAYTEIIRAEGVADDGALEAPALDELILRADGSHAPCGSDDNPVMHSHKHAAHGAADGEDAAEGDGHDAMHSHKHQHTGDANHDHKHPDSIMRADGVEEEHDHEAEGDDFLAEGDHTDEEYAFIDEHGDVPEIERAAYGGLATLDNLQAGGSKASHKGTHTHPATSKRPAVTHSHTHAHTASSNHHTTKGGHTKKQAAAVAAKTGSASGTMITRAELGDSEGLTAAELTGFLIGSMDPGNADDLALLAVDSDEIQRAIAEKEGAPKSPPKGKPSDKSQYADPTNFEYPVDEKHIRAAVQFYNAGKGKAKYTSEEWASVGRKVVASANKLLGKGYSMGDDGTIDTPSMGDDEVKRSDDAPTEVPAPAFTPVEELEVITAPAVTGQAPRDLSGGRSMTPMFDQKPANANTTRSMTQKLDKMAVVTNGEVTPLSEPEKELAIVRGEGIEIPAQEGTRPAAAEPGVQLTTDGTPPAMSLSAPSVEIKRDGIDDGELSDATEAVTDALNPDGETAEGDTGEEVLSAPRELKCAAIAQQAIDLIGQCLVMETEELAAGAAEEYDLSLLRDSLYCLKSFISSETAEAVAFMRSRKEANDAMTKIDDIERSYGDMAERLKVLEDEAAEIKRSDPLSGVTSEVTALKERLEVVERAPRQGTPPVARLGETVDRFLGGEDDIERALTVMEEQADAMGFGETFQRIRARAAYEQARSGKVRGGESTRAFEPYVPSRG